MSRHVLQTFKWTVGGHGIGGAVQHKNHISSSPPVLCLVPLYQAKAAPPPLSSSSASRLYTCDSVHSLACADATANKRGKALTKSTLSILSKSSSKFSPDVGPKILWLLFFEIKPGIHGEPHPSYKIYVARLYVVSYSLLRHGHEPNVIT